jgi:hypothetical protein
MSERICVLAWEEPAVTGVSRGEKLHIYEDARLMADELNRVAREQRRSWHGPAKPNRLPHRLDVPTKPEVAPRTRAVQRASLAIRRAAWAAWAVSSASVAGAAQWQMFGHSRTQSAPR